MSLRALSYTPVGEIRAENAIGYIHPDDRKYGVLAAGVQGTGKCIAADDLVLLAGRLIRAEDAWREYATSVECDGEGWWSTPLEQPLTAAFDESRGRIVAAPVTRLYRQRVSERGRRVRISDGSELTITRQHPLRGPDDWTTDVIVGDLLCVPRVIDYPGRPVDLELAELIAWQIAEGCERRDVRSRKGSNRVMITQGDRTVLERLQAIAERVSSRLGLNMNTPYICRGTSAYDLVINSAEWRDWLIARGYRWGQRSAGKAIPDFLMQGDLECARVLLTALCDAEGHVAAGNRTVEVMTASRMLGEQIRMLLRRFGILASFRTRRLRATNGSRTYRDYRRLTIMGGSLRRFMAEIGFGSHEKNSRLHEMLHGVKPNSNREGVYVRDVLREIRDLGVPVRWVSPRSFNYVDTLRASHLVAAEMVQAIREAADRIDRGEFTRGAARGKSAARARAVTLAAVDTRRVRELSDLLEARVQAEIFYLTVEEVEDVQIDGWVYDFEVGQHHNYVAGGMLAHNTSVLLRQFANDVMDRGAAQIVMDPKMELVERCLEVIPPDCGKEVWYLDLGNPVFGMTPLRMHGDSDFGTEAAAVAESVVAALLAIAPGQIFQSSRRYLYHAVIGALAIAHEHPQLRHGMFEHVHGLLLPKGPGEALRQVAAQACARLGLEQTAFFYTQELPGELQIAGHQAAARLDPPRNKIDGIVGVPPLKRFFQHPHDVSMRDLVERRAILLVNGNMARIGEDNAQVCMHFIFQMLHRQMQHQMHLPEAERPRVALIADEAGYLLSRNVVHQIATHRAAGLDVAIGIQYLGQLGAGAESGSVTEEIRKGVTNLLQSRFLFRLSDPRDADEVSRIAMALVSTMTQQDPDSRAYRRVGPEVMLNIENYFCLCSWIAGGGRIGSFIGQTFEMPRPAWRWAEEHLARLRAAVGTPPADFVRTTAQLTDPEQLLAALGGRAQATAGAPARSNVGPVETAANEVGPTGGEEGDGSSAVPVERLFTEVPAGRDPHFDSPALRVFGRPYARGEVPETADGRIAPASLRDLALVDRMTSITRWQEKPPARQPRLVDVDYAILRLLDRAGILLVPLLARACMPGKAERTVRQKLAKLHDAGLIARGEIDVHDRSPGTGALPSAVRLTSHGFRIGQQREVIDPDKQWRPSEVSERALSVPHDQHVIAWITALTRLLGERVVTDNWRTPRTRHGVIGPPQIGDGRNRHVLAPAELRPPAAGYAFDGAFTPAGPNDRFAELKPDATIELRIPGQFTFDLLFELTLTAKPSHNRAKFAAYDAFLLGWWREHRRYQHLRGRPVVLFVFASEDALRANAEIADREITGRLGIIGIPQHEWYWPAREHTFFAQEEDIHHGALRCFALPKLPKSVRDALGQQEPTLREVRMLPSSLRVERARVVPPADPPPAEGAELEGIQITRPMPGVRLADCVPGAGMAWLEALRQIEQVGRAETVDAARLTARTTLDEHDRGLLATLDRTGLAPTELLAMASADDLTPRALAGRLARLHREGLIVRHRPHSPGGAALPPLFSITAEGMRTAQTQRPPAISTRRRWQSAEGEAATEVVRRVGALAWTLALRRAAAGIATDNWRTSRYESGRYPVPRGADGQAVTVDDLPVPPELRLADVPNEFVEVKPDVSLELRLPASQASIELLVDIIDAGQDPTPILLAYDAFLAGWCLADPRLARQSDRPVVMLVCPNVQAALSCARRADDLLRARVGSPEQPPERWRYPGRERVLIAVENAIHHDERAVLTLPPVPFTGQFQVVELLGEG